MSRKAPSPALDTFVEFVIGGAAIFGLLFAMVAVLLAVDGLSRALFG